MNPIIQQHAETVLQFGDFQFHPYKRLLLQGERPVRIGSRALDILQVLIARPGEIIAKEAIIAQVWGDTVVEEINLRVHIAALRRALGEGRTGERYIANVPLRGYGFVGMVEAQVLAAGQALVSPVTPEGRLPVMLMGLVGRDSLIRRLLAQLPHTRLLTLVAPGGMGKTSLAIHACERLAERYGRIGFLDLSSEAQGTSLVERLAGFCGTDASASALCLLDNCEHLAGACAGAVEQALRQSPGLTILATSREPLHAEGEHVLRLPPLDLPAHNELSLAEALKYSAVQLFVLRAREVCYPLRLKPAQVPTIIEICRRLDGIPLALEIAARQVDILGLDGLMALLDSPVHLGMPGRRTAPARQQSLRATYDWSFSLLSAAEQQCLRLLARLGSAFSLEAAVDALGGSLLCQDCRFAAVCRLADKSLLQVEQGANGVRFRIPNTARTYMLEMPPLSLPGVAIPAA